MKFLPENDGVDHINVYSKGKTSLGRFLSNFYYCHQIEIKTEHGPFKTVEGYWYYLSLLGDPSLERHPDKEKLRTLKGRECKQLGRELRTSDWPKTEHFEDYILQAIAYKIFAHPGVLQELKDSTLPFTHYYVVGTKVIQVLKGDWMLQFIDFIRRYEIDHPTTTGGQETCSREP